MQRISGARYLHIRYLNSNNCEVVMRLVIVNNVQLIHIVTIKIGKKLRTLTDLVCRY